MMKGLKKLSLAIGAVLVLSLSASIQLSSAQEAVRIGTSSMGSLWYTVAIGASEIIQKYGNLNTTVEPLGGSSANIFGLGAKKIEFAMANSFAAFSGYYGTYTFKKPVDIRLVLQGQPNFRIMVVRKGTNIKTPEDLIGKTVIGKRRALPENEVLMDAFLKVFKLPKDKIKIVATTTSPETYDALRAGSVDAAIVPGSRRTAAIEKPIREGVIEFMYLSKEQRDAILKLLPKAFYADTFEPGGFTGQDKPLHTFGMNTYFITRTDMSEDVVYRMAKALLEHTAEFATYHKAALQWTAKSTLSNVALPFHAGVIRYFKEKGLWTPELEATQKEFLSR
ncbi:MAG: TAXI family TRAP transporter solute-binding subunit [Desulfobacterales bacterium]|nr:TAXI family TRAP transporter solute-binding subunit [Desulfobacterales bacterium]